MIGEKGIICLAKYPLFFFIFKKGDFRKWIFKTANLTLSEA